MLLKVLLIAALALIGWRLIFGRWPWPGGQAAVPRRIEPVELEAEKARVLLGLPEGAGRDQIIEAHRKLVVQVHPDRGGTNELVHEANAARDLLLDEWAIATGVKR